MTENGKAVPILGQGGKKPMAGVQTIGALIHHLNDDGEYEPENVALLPDGSGRMVAIPGRQNYVTAEDLVEMIEEMVRRVVREEVKLAAIGK